MGHHPQVADREQPLTCEPVIRHPGLCSQGSREMPISLAAQGGENGLAFSRAEREEVADLGANASPLFPVAHADAPSQPPIELRHGTVVVRDGEVTPPASEVLGELVEPVVHRHAPAASRQSTDTVAEVVEGLVGPAKLGPSESKPSSCINRWPQRA